MPCSFCVNIFFDRKPCKTEINPIPIGSSDRDILNIIKQKLYSELRRECPCMECIVKIMCDEQRHCCLPWVSKIKIINKDYQSGAI